MHRAFTDGEMSNLHAEFGQLSCAWVVEYDPVCPRHPWRNLRKCVLADYHNKRYVDVGIATAAGGSPPGTPETRQ